MNVGRYACHDIVCTFTEKVKKFIRELRDVANHVNTRPNALGRQDKNKINFVHRQLHPSMIGTVDLLEFTKDVGQSGMLSPWADMSILHETDVNKYPNIKYDLFKYIQDTFDNSAIAIKCDNIIDFNKMLDKLVRFSTIDVDYNCEDLARANEFNARTTHLSK